RGETGWLLRLNDRPQGGLRSPHVWRDQGIAGTVPSPPATPPARGGTRRSPTVQQGADRLCPYIGKASAHVCRHDPLPKPSTLWRQEEKLLRQLTTRVRTGPAPLLLGAIQESAVLGGDARWPRGGRFGRAPVVLRTVDTGPPVGHRALRRSAPPVPPPSPAHSGRMPPPT